MKLLLAEDDPFYAQTIADLLADRGIAVDCVSSTQEALHRHSKRYYAVILDAMLPNDPSLSGLSERETQGGFRSGISVARKLRRKDSTIRIVILSANPAGTGATAWCEASNIPCVSKGDGPIALLGALERIGVTSQKHTPRSFIVHGHDQAALQEVRRYVCDHLKWQPPIVLREQPSGGKTIIEKFEDAAYRADCVFVLLTPDDAPIRRGIDAKRRSRQNVIFELGFFYGQLRRRSGRIFILYKGRVELPSDIHGIVWIDITQGVMSADSEIQRELAAAGLITTEVPGAAASAGTNPPKNGVRKRSRRTVPPKIIRAGASR